MKATFEYFFRYTLHYCICYSFFFSIKNAWTFRELWHNAGALVITKEQMIQVLFHRETVIWRYAIVCFVLSVWEEGYGANRVQLSFNIALSNIPLFCFTFHTATPCTLPPFPRPLPPALPSNSVQVSFPFMTPDTRWQCRTKRSGTWEHPGWSPRGIRSEPFIPPLWE